MGPVIYSLTKEIRKFRFFPLDLGLINTISPNLDCYDHDFKHPSSNTI